MSVVELILAIIGGFMVLRVIVPVVLVLPYAAWCGLVWLWERYHEG